MPRKKALLIGINYRGTQHELNGCINDAKNCREFLVTDRGFSAAPDDMVILTDAQENEGTPFYPTKENILNAFNWLVTYNEPGDSVWLSYSGHGGQVKDPDGDRDSGCDLIYETQYDI
jgi:metacaspase-1